MDKKQLRAQQIQRRKALPLELKQCWEQIITKQVFPLLEYYEKIGLYLSMDFEVDTKPIIRLLSDRLLLAPVVGKEEMAFHPITNGFKTHPYGMIEPIPSSDVIPEVLVIPMIGFTTEHYRLGFGKGYYDRYLKDFVGDHIGLAFEMDRLDFKPETWDVPVSRIITEKTIYQIT